LIIKLQHAILTHIKQQGVEMSDTYTNIVKLKPFVKSVSNKTADKAITDMSRALVAALSEAKIDVDDYLAAYKEDKIFNPSCLLGNHDDIFAFVDNRYKILARIMFEMRPVGLGTPNAMVGEGEFMALFLSPRVGISKKKNSGDLTVDGKTIELKGTQLRFFSPMKTTGKQVQTHATEVSLRYGVLPNKAGKGKNSKDTDFQPWGNCFGDAVTSKGKPRKDPRGIKQHWIEQFKKLGIEKSCQYLAEFCGVFVECQPKDFADCFDTNGLFIESTFQFLLVKKMFAGMEKKWDAFTQIDNGRISCITDDNKQFNQIVDSGKLKMDGCYFRSNQPITVGLYVKLC
jgi:hypothetical protein